MFNAKVALGPSLALNFRVLQSNFSTGVGSLGSQTYPLSAANPNLGCSPLQNSAVVAGTVVLMERGNCTFELKGQYAQAAGAAAVIVFDSEVGAYYSATSSGGTVGIPLMTIPRRLGQNVMAVLVSGRSANVTFGPATEPAYGFDNLASFSSQGPVGSDRRVKPDLVAPGTLTSADAGTQCGTTTYGGTSMATPVIASSALLVKQYFEDGYYPSGAPNQADSMTPSSALLKAMLVGGAASLQGYEADTGLPIDPPPSFRQGYGRVFLGNSLYLQGNQYSPPRLQVVDAVPINSGDVHQYCISAGGGALSVTLVWTDYPGNPSALKSLVNDLDLVVRAEGFNGIPILGNGGDVDDSTVPDSVNNIESVTLPAVPQGRVAVEVRGSAVQASAGPQPYALVVNGDFSGNLTTSGQCAIVLAVIQSGPSGVTNAQSPTFEIGTESGTAAGVQLECQLADAAGVVGSQGTQDWQPCSSPVTFNNLPDGAYTFSVRAQGESIDSSTTFTKDTTPPTITLSPLAGTTTDNSATFDFSANDATAVVLQCQVTLSGAAPQQGPVTTGSFTSTPVQLGQWFNCTSPQTLAWMLPGAWTFSVLGTDAAGNQAKPTTASWQVGLDPSKHYVRIIDGPILAIPKREVLFDFLALPDSGGAGIECSLANGGPVAQPSEWKACTSPVSYGQPSDGNYTFFARVQGDQTVPAPGATTPDTWAMSTFTVDSTAPTVNISSGPTQGEAVPDSTITFDFVVSEEGSSTQCQ